MNLPDGIVDRLLRNEREGLREFGLLVRSRAVRDYLDPERFAQEMSRLFHATPILVCHSSRLSTPGDFVTHDRLGVPLLLVRQTDGGVGAFINICRHRAAAVEAAACGHRSSFLCPYHHWTYGIDGALQHIADGAGFAGVDPSQLGLRRVAVAEQHGLVFVRIADGPAIDLDQFLGPIAADLDRLGVSRHRYFHARDTALGCNWKVQMEGSLETYHFGFLHAGSAGRQFASLATIWDDCRPHQRWFMPRRKLAEKLANGADARHSILPNYFLFPNTVLTIPHDHLIITQVFPQGVDRCVFHNELLPAEHSVPVEAGYWERALDYNESVIREDLPVIESIQRSCAAEPDGTVLQGRYEQGVSWFHDACDERLRPS